MFATPADRHTYETALTMHDELMFAASAEARSYQRGYSGADERYDDVHEFWRAGVKNRFNHEHMSK